MKCPFCSFEESKVTDSRVISEGNTIKRRRECLKCSGRFTTFETADLTISVRKRNGTFETFSKEKLIRGMDIACYHSTVSHDMVRGIVNKIVGELLQKNIREVNSQHLGEMVMGHLIKIDVIAYIRFACVYKRFRNVAELMESIGAMPPIPKGLQINKNEEIFYGA